MNPASKRKSRNRRNRRAGKAVKVKNLVRNYFCSAYKELDPKHPYHEAFHDKLLMTHLRYLRKQDDEFCKKQTINASTQTNSEPEIEEIDRPGPPQILYQYKLPPSQGIFNKSKVTNDLVLRLSPKIRTILNYSPAERRQFRRALMRKKMALKLRTTLYPNKSSTIRPVTIMNEEPIVVSD